MKDPSKKREKQSVKIGGSQTIHYEKESSKYSEDEDKPKPTSEDEDDSENESDLA